MNNLSKYFFKTIAFSFITVVCLQLNALAQVQSKPADKFVDMIGVCVHSSRNNNQYTNSSSNPRAEQTTINTLLNLSIRHLRTGVYGWNGGVEDSDYKRRGVVTRFKAISDAGKIGGIPGGFTWIITDNTDDWRRLRDRYLVPLGDRVIVLEGANENMGTSGNSQAYTQIKNWWINILPVLPNLKIATNTGPTAACQIVTAPSINDFVHFGNAHPYHFWPPFKPWGRLNHCNFNSTCAPPTISLWTAPDNNGGTIGYIDATRARRVAADKPMIFTEWGYPTISNDKNGWGVDEATAAKYMVRGFLEHFNAGIVYSCSYQLMDPDPITPFNADPEKHFGLAYNDGVLKPSGTAVKRLIALLEDKGNTNIATGTLNYTLGANSLGYNDDKNATTNEIHQMLLQKANGKFYLILWQEAISTNPNGVGINILPTNVTVDFGQNLSTLKAYLPTTTDNNSPVVDVTNVSSHTFSVPDHPLVIEIGTEALLPLSLVSFGAKLVNGKPYLKWVTENEQNVSHFEIEKSNDGINFIKIKTFNSKGGGVYNFVDNLPQIGNNYYRLKMIDTDGKFDFSRTEVINFSLNTPTGFSIYPNPNNGNFTISPSHSKIPSTVTIFNQQGRIMVKKEILGTSNISVDNLIKGVYLIQLNTGGLVEVKKMVKE